MSARNKPAAKRQRRIERTEKDEARNLASSGESNRTNRRRKGYEPLKANVTSRWKGSKMFKLNNHIKNRNKGTSAH